MRCALVAYSKISDSSVIDKIRGLFLYMWRAINRSVPRAFAERRNVSTYAGDLLAGAMLFNKRFTAAWAADGYRDYLAPDAPMHESGKAVLLRMLHKGGGGGGHLSGGNSGTLMTDSDALLAGGADIFGPSSRTPRAPGNFEVPPLHGAASHSSASDDGPLYLTAAAAQAHTASSAVIADAGAVVAPAHAPLVYYGSGRVEPRSSSFGAHVEYGY